MTTTEKDTSRRRRLLVIFGTFAAGAIAAVGVMTGVGVPGSSDATESTRTVTTSSTSTNVAQTTAPLDCERHLRARQPRRRRHHRHRDGLPEQQRSRRSPRWRLPAVQAEGTGYVYDKSGHIITADHVVSGATKITVRSQDGSTATATLVGTDASTDTAVIKVSVPSSKLTPLALADSSTVDAGRRRGRDRQPVRLLREHHGRHRQRRRPRRSRRRTATRSRTRSRPTPPINHGNSGGPLIDESGKVIGTNVQIAVDDQNGGSANAGVGFAVPSNTVKAVADDADRRQGRPARLPRRRRRRLAVRQRRADRHGQVRRPGRGRGPQPGDVITAIDGKPDRRRERAHRRDRAATSPVTRSISPSRAAARRSRSPSSSAPALPRRRPERRFQDHDSLPGRAHSASRQ